MTDHADEQTKIVVIGLGYVGLPLAVALARQFDVLGFDIDAGRIAELRAGRDRTDEVASAALAASTLRYSDRPDELIDRTVFIVTVPTPVDAHAKPDLTALTDASKMLSTYLKPGALVIYESTVYPGVTEEHCGPILEQGSGLRCGQDFFLGYSPERMNPGDRDHTVDKLTKVVAGQTPEIAARLAEIYGRITSAGIHVAPDIRTAEAAKAIENAQRDINIAFINEVSLILDDLGLNAYDVLEAAETKWNFLPFRPGLVGGHCIGVDPYYLAHVAELAGHHPEIVLAGRKINDAMGPRIADRIWREIDRAGARVLILGLTFKEDVPDLRNSKVIDIITRLRAHGAELAVHDPLANAEQARALLGFALSAEPEESAPFDAVVGAVSHAQYRQLTAEQLAALTVSGGLIADVKGMWRGLSFPAGIRHWQL